MNSKCFEHYRCATFIRREVLASQTDVRTPHGECVAFFCQVFSAKSRQQLAIEENYLRILCIRLCNRKNWTNNLGYEAMKSDIENWSNIRIDESFRLSTDDRTMLEDW